MIPSSHKASVVSQPAYRPLDLPSPAVSAKSPAVLRRFLPTVGPVRGDKFDPHSPELAAELVAVVGFVTDQPLRPRPARAGFAPRPHRLERLLGERDLRRAGGVYGNSQRKTLAVCHHHKLCAFPPLGLPDAQAPFFAGANVPSMKHSPHAILPRLLTWERNALQILSQTPCFCHNIRRRQQVLGLGYLSGRFFQRAPVRRTHRIPSRTSRLLRQGLPRLVILGSRGSIFSHCSSVRYTPRLTGFTSYEPLSATTYVGL